MVQSAVKLQCGKYWAIYATGLSMSGDDTRGIILTKGNTIIKFDIKIEKPGGVPDFMSNIIHL